MMSFLLSPMVILIVAAAVAWSGLVLLIAALVPRREGATRYCRKCGYDLSGTTGDICSECGADLTLLKAVVVGQRLRKPGRVIVALSMLLIGLLPLGLVAFAKLASVDWYQHYPTLLVLQNLRSSSEKTAERALREVQRRRATGEFAKHYLDNLAEVCLEEHAQEEPRSPIGYALLTELGNMYVAGELTDDQVERMLENCIGEVDIRVRSPVVPERCFPIEILTQEHIPAHQWIHSEMMSLAIDGQTVPAAKSRLYSHHWGDLHAVGFCEPLPMMHAGTHSVSVEMRFWSTADTVAANIDPCAPILEEVHRLETSFELLAAEPESYIRVIRDPTIDRQMADSISLYFSRPAYSICSGEQELEAVVRFARDLPLNVMFDLLVEADGRVLGRDIVEQTSHKTEMHHHCSIHTTQAIPERVDIRLIANPDEAAKTIDVFEIWGGGLLFTDVEIPASDVKFGTEKMTRPTLIGSSETSSE